MEATFLTELEKNNEFLIDSQASNFTSQHSIIDCALKYFYVPTQISKQFSRRFGKLLALLQFWDKFSTLVSIMKLDKSLGNIKRKKKECFWVKYVIYEVLPPFKFSSNLGVFYCQIIAYSNLAAPSNFLFLDGWATIKVAYFYWNISQTVTVM